MSSHCDRYPDCGCSSVIGTKCHLDGIDERLGQIEPTFGDEVEMKKSKIAAEAERIDRGGSSLNPRRKHARNYTPPKKRKRK